MRDKKVDEIIKAFEANLKRFEEEMAQIRAESALAKVQIETIRQEVAELMPLKELVEEVQKDAK